MTSPLRMAEAAAIYLVVPLNGILAYALLCFQMHRERIPRPPFPQFFVLFTTYGGLVLVLLTDRLGWWSAMASLGTFYLIVGAPFVMFILAAQLRSLRPLSRYHRAAFYASAAYLPIWLLTFGIYFMASSHR